jgi:hypothetical protein
MSFVASLHLRFKLEMFVFQMGKGASPQDVYMIIISGIAVSEAFVAIISKPEWAKNTRRI